MNMDYLGKVFFFFNDFLRQRTDVHPFLGFPNFKIHFDQSILNLLFHYELFRFRFHAAEMN